jgi:hypothetical protein
MDVDKLRREIVVSNATLTLNRHTVATTSGTMSAMLHDSHYGNVF